MSLAASREYSHIPARKVRALTPADYKLENYQDLSRIGISLDSKKVNQMMAGMDVALTPSITTPSLITPLQFLQAWLPGFVRVATAPRVIDELTGITTVGEWRDYEVVQGIMELTGSAQPYGDYTNVPMSSWNTNFVVQTIVRFEQGMQVGVLEEERAAAINLDSGSAKREAAALSLEIVRNLVGFYGYNGGANNTYGFLNAPNLPAYITAPNGASTSPLWSTKTYLEITADIRLMVIGLRNSSAGLIDPKRVDITLALPIDVVDFLGTVSQFGNSVQDWLDKTYPKIRVISAPELNLANGGANVAYMYAERFQDKSTDDGRIFLQGVPTKFKVLGIDKKSKTYEEDYSNATMGVMCKRPWAVFRLTGI